MSSAPDIFLPRDGAAKIAASAAQHGALGMDHVDAENFYIVNVIEIAAEVRVPVDIPKEYKVLKWASSSYVGQWVKRAAEDTNLIHRQLLHRPTHEIAFDEFRKLIPEVTDPGGQTGFLITYDPNLPDDLRELGVAEYAGWLVNRTGVRPLALEVELETLGIKQLEGLWPVEALAGNSVMVIGCGSIGGATAEALARYGVGNVELVDPDRLRWHNTLRHVLRADSVGSYKATALARDLQDRWPSQRFQPHMIDVVSDAHEVRALLPNVDLVICAADGIAARRVVSHLARRAGKPAVLACVLDNGTFGEVLRLRPTPRFGCLLCLRDQLSAEGAMDIEAAQERDYGTGHVHLPMTAVPPDLHLVGMLAAKVAVATLLESLHGDNSQRIPDEYALAGLRPTGDLAAPFDLTRAGEIRWLPIPAPRPNCPTCNP